MEGEEEFSGNAGRSGPKLLLAFLCIFDGVLGGNPSAREKETYRCRRRPT